MAFRMRVEEDKKNLGVPDVGATTVEIPSAKEQVRQTVETPKTFDATPGVGINNVNNVTPTVKTTYQNNLYQPTKWYAGDTPTFNEALKEGCRIYKQDKNAGTDILADLFMSRTEATSPFFDPYLAPTNSAVAELKAYGIDTDNLSQDWINQNRSYIYNNLIYNGTTNTPSKPGAKATVDQKIAYALYQWDKSEKATQKAEQQWEALQQELTYLAQDKAHNYSDDEIMKMIDWSKYSELSSMDENSVMSPNEYNRAIGYSKDSMYGVLWAARNPEFKGDNMNAMINAGLGTGYLWEENPEVSAKLNKNNKETYSPYSVGMTMREEGKYFNKYEFADEDIDEIGRTLDYTDETAVKYYQNLLEGNKRTHKLEDQRAALNDWLDYAINVDKYNPEDIISMLYDEQDWGEDENFEPYNFKDLFSLDDTMISTDLVGTTRAIDYKRSDIENYIREKCAARDGAPSIEHDINETLGLTQGDVVEEQPNVYEQSWNEISRCVSGSATQAENDTMRYGTVDSVQRSKDMSVAGHELTYEATDNQFNSAIHDRANADYLSAYGTVTQYESKKAERDSLIAEIERSKEIVAEYENRYNGYTGENFGQDGLLTDTDVKRIDNIKDIDKEYIAENIQSNDLDAKKDGYVALFENAFYGDVYHDMPSFVEDIGAAKSEAELNAILEQNPIIQAYADAVMNGTETAPGNEFKGGEYTEGSKRQKRILDGLSGAEFEDWEANLQNITELGKRVEQMDAELAAEEADYNAAKSIQDDLRSDFDTYNSTSATRDDYLSNLELYYNASTYDTPYGYYSFTPWQELVVEGYAPEELQGFAVNNFYAYTNEVNTLEDILADPHKYGLVTFDDVTADPNAFEEKYEISIDNALSDIMNNPRKYGITMSAQDIEHVKQRIAVDRKEMDQAVQFLYTTLDDFDEKANVGKNIIPTSEVTRNNMYALLNGGEVTGSNSEWEKQFGSSGIDAKNLARGYISLMTEDEINGYFYRLEEFGEDEANRYFQSLVDENTGVVMHRYAEALKEKDTSYAKESYENALWSRLESYFYNVVGGAESFSKSIDNQIKGVKNADPNGVGYLSSNKRDALRAGVSEYYRGVFGDGAAGDVFDTILNATFSAGDSAINALLVGGAFKLIGDAVPAAGKILTFLESGSDNRYIAFGKDAVYNWMHAVPMAWQAADNAYREVIANNGTKEQAQAMFNSTFWAESMTEAITVGNIREMVNKGALGEAEDLISSLIMNGMEEAVGEGFNQWWEDTAERYIMGAMSTYNQQVEALVAAGVPRTKAEEIADKQIAKNAIIAAASGFISSGFSGTSAYVKGSVTEAVSNWQASMIQRDVMKLDAAKGKDSASVGIAMAAVLQDTKPTKTSPEQTEEKAEAKPEKPAENVVESKEQPAKEETTKEPVKESTKESSRDTIESYAASAAVQSLQSMFSDEAALKTFRGIEIASSNTALNAKFALKTAGLVNGEARKVLSAIVKNVDNGVKVTFADVSNLVRAAQKDTTGKNAIKSAYEIAMKVDEYIKAQKTLELVAKTPELANAVTEAQKNVSEAKKNAKATRDTKERADAKVESVNENREAATKKQLSKRTKEGTAEVQHATAELVGAVNDQVRATEQANQAEQKVKEAEKELKKTSDEVMAQARGQASVETEQLRADAAQEAQEELVQVNAERNPTIAFDAPVVKHMKNGQEVTLTGVFAVRNVMESMTAGSRPVEVTRFIYTTPEGYIYDSELMESSDEWEGEELDAAFDLTPRSNPVKPQAWLPHSISGLVDGKEVDIVGLAGLGRKSRQSEADVVLVMGSDGTVYRYNDLRNLQDKFTGENAGAYFWREYRRNQGDFLPTYEGEVYAPAARGGVQALMYVPEEYDYGADLEAEDNESIEQFEFETQYDDDYVASWDEEPATEVRNNRDVVLFPEVFSVQTGSGEVYVNGITTDHLGNIYFVDENENLVRGVPEEAFADLVKDWFSQFSYLTREGMYPATDEDIEEFENVLEGNDIELEAYNEDGINKGYVAPFGTIVTYNGKEYYVRGLQRFGKNVYYDVITDNEDDPTLINYDLADSVSEEDWAKKAKKALLQVVKHNSFMETENAEEEYADDGSIVLEQKEPVVTKVSSENELPDDLKQILSEMEFVEDDFTHYKYAAIPDWVEDAKFGKERIIGVGAGDYGGNIKFYVEDENGDIEEYSKQQLCGTGREAHGFFTGHSGLSDWLLTHFIPVAETGVKFSDLGVSFKESAVKGLREDITGRETVAPRHIPEYKPSYDEFSEGKTNPETGEKLANWQIPSFHGKVSPRSEQAEYYLNKKGYPTSEEFKKFFAHNSKKALKYTLDKNGNPRIFLRGIGKITHNLYGILNANPQDYGGTTVTKDHLTRNFFVGTLDGVMPYTETGEILKLRYIDNWETAKAAMQDIGYDLVPTPNSKGQMGYQLVTKTKDGYVEAFGLQSTWFAENELDFFRKTYGGNPFVDGIQAGYIASEHPVHIDAKNQDWRGITATLKTPDGETITDTMTTDDWAAYAFKHGADALFFSNIVDGGPITFEAITNKPNMFKSVYNNGQWNWDEDQYLALRTRQAQPQGPHVTHEDNGLYELDIGDEVPATPTEKQAKKVIEKLKTPQSVFMDLIRELGIGNFMGTNNFGNQPKSTQGLYDPHANNLAVRSAEMGNPDVPSHEIGHGIAKLLNMTGTQKMVDSLYRYNELRADDEKIDLDSYTPYQLQDEAFAEFFKYYLVNEETARDFAGDDFTDMFESNLFQNPKAYEAVMKAKGDLETWFAASGEQRFASTIKDGDEKKRLTLRKFMQNIVGILADQSIAAEDVNHAIRKANGGELVFSEDTRSMSLLTNFSQKQAINLLTRNLTDAEGTVVRDKNGLSLAFKEMLDRVGFVGTKENIELLERYGLALHSYYREKQGKRVSDKSVWTPQERNAFIKEIRQTRPDIVGAEAAYQAFRHNVLQKWLVDTGIWDQEFLNKLEKMYPHHMSTFRIGGNVKSSDTGPSGGKEFSTKAAKGSSQDIYSPINSLIVMVDQITSMVNQNRAAQTFDNVYRKYEGLGFWARRVPGSTSNQTAVYKSRLADILEQASEEGGISDDVLQSILDLTQTLRGQSSEENNVLTVYRKDGSAVKYEFNEDGAELYKLLAGVQDNSDIRVFEIVGKLNRMMSMLTTGSNPLFAARNATRDYQNSVNKGTWASNYLTAFPKWAKAFAEIAKGKSDAVQQYYAFGGGGWTRIERGNRKSMNEIRGEIFGDDKSTTGKTAKWLGKKVWEFATLSQLNEWIEQTSRFVEYKYGNHDISTAEGRQEAFLAAQDVTVDFSRSGNSALARMLKKTVPFFGASMQGVYRTARQFSEAERGMIGDTLGETVNNFVHSRAAARLTKTIVNTALASALASYFILKFGDDDDKDEFANILSSGIKANHLILPNPFSGFGSGEDNGNAPFIRIPLEQSPLGYAVHAAVTNAMWNGIADEYAIDLAATVDVIGDNLNPMGSGTIFQPLIDVSHNRTWYGSNLVRNAMADWTDPTGQYNEDTPRLFRVLGRLFNQSPEVMEYLATQYTGFVGSLTIPALSEDEKGNLGGLSAVMNSVIKKWTADPYSSNDATNRFYDHVANLETIKDEAKQNRPQGLMLRSLTQDDVNTAYREAEDMLSSDGIIGETKKKISAAYERIDKINSNENLDDTQRAKLVREEQKLLNNYVEEANKQLEAYEKKYIKGETLTDRMFGGLIKGVEEGKYAHIPTVEERTLDTFQEDSDERYMQMAREVYRATGSEAAFPHPEQTLAVTNRGKIKDEYEISDEDWPRYQEIYKDAYVRYVNKNGRRWENMTTDKKKQVLSGAHSAGNDAMRKQYQKDHPDINQNTTGQYGLGNIDLNSRSVLENDDGSISTEESFSFYDEDTGKEVLIPSIINGKRVSEYDAIDYYYQTGEYLGMFDTPAQADAYAEKLHNRQDWYYHR